MTRPMPPSPLTPPEQALEELFAARARRMPEDGLTVTAVLFLIALSVAASIFLILEMDQPFEGLIKISGEPMRYALSHLGQ